MQGSAMDQQVIYEIFTNLLEAAKILNIKSELTAKISDQLQN